MSSLFKRKNDDASQTMQFLHFNLAPSLGKNIRLLHNISTIFEEFLLLVLFKKILKLATIVQNKVSLLTTRVIFVWKYSKSMSKVTCRDEFFSPAGLPEHLFSFPSSMPPFPHSPAKGKCSGQIYGMALPATFVTPVTSSRIHLIKGVGCACQTPCILSNSRIWGGGSAGTHLHSTTSIYIDSFPAHWSNMALIESQSCGENPESVDTSLSSHIYQFKHR